MIEAKELLNNTFIELAEVFNLNESDTAFLVDIAMKDYQEFIECSEVKFRIVTLSKIHFISKCPIEFTRELFPSEVDDVIEEASLMAFKGQLLEAGEELEKLDELLMKALLMHYARDIKRLISDDKSQAAA